LGTTQELQAECGMKVFNDKQMVFILAEIIGIDATIELLKRNTQERYGSLTSSDVKSIYDKQYTEIHDGLPAAETVSGFRIHHYCQFIFNHLREHEKRQSVAIMDFGCGAGELDLALGSMGFRVHGVDIDADAIATAKAKLARCPALSGTVEFFRADTLKAFKDRYDYILLSDVIEHLGEGELKDLLYVFSNLLKDDGKVLIHTPNGNVDRVASRGVYHVLVLIRESLRSCWRKLTGFRSTEADLLHQFYLQTHINIMSPGRIKSLLKAKGFGQTKIYYRFDRPILLPSLLASIGLSTDMGIVAHKNTVPHVSGSDNTGSRRIKAASLLLFKILISGLLVWVLSRKVNFAEVWLRAASVGWPYLAGAMLCSLTALVLASRRWQVLSSGLLSFGQALKYTWIGLFYGAILPGAISGDVAKGAAIALKNKHVRVGNLPLSILTDRVLGLYVLLGFFTVSCAVLHFGTRALDGNLKQLSFYGFVGGSLALSVGAGAVAVARKLLSGSASTCQSRSRLGVLIGRARDAFRLYTSQPRLFLQALGYSVVIHGVNVAAYYLVIRALVADCQVREVIVFYSIVSVLISLPVTLSGVGVRDWFALSFFQALWRDGQAGVAFSWVSLLLGLMVAASGGIVQMVDLFAPRESSPRDPKGDYKAR
jgi:hypothetical protein